MAIWGKDNDADAARNRWELLASQVAVGLSNFVKIGTALREIRDRELYKVEYRTFDECCTDRWKLSLTHANRLINAATVSELLTPTGVVPTSERQVRPLTTLEPEEQVEAWEEAVAEGATVEAVERAVRKRRPAKAKKLKPIRLRAPGAWVIIEPNKKFTNAEVSLLGALEKLRHELRDAA